MTAPREESSSQRMLYALCAMFFLSGIAGLIYQVVWLRMLLRSFGVSVYAVSSVVSVFMTGLALGSYFANVPLRRWGSAPLRLYGIIEIGIGVFALGSSIAIALLPGFFAGFGASSSTTLAALRVLLSSALLLPPTILMGTTLPVLARFLAEQPERVGRHAGLLYGINTLGAVTGVLLTGFFLIAVAGEKRTVGVAIALNVLVGVLCLLLDRSTPAPATVEASTETTPAPTYDATRTVLFAAAGQGFCALSFEVLWSRNLTVLLGNSVYGFSFMLGSYLLGVGLGSLLIARVIDRVRRPLLVFAVLEMLLGCLALISVQVFVLLGLVGANARQAYALLWSLGDFRRLGLEALLVVMPVTLLLGMTFPVASRLAAAGKEGTERSVGRLYAVNTVGGILGSVLTGFVLIPTFGTPMTFVLSAALSVAIGAVLLRASAQSGEEAKHRGILLGHLLVFVALLSVSFLDPVLLILRARIQPHGEQVLAHSEERGVTVTMTRTPDQGRHLFLNGLYVSSTSNVLPIIMLDMPLTFHPRPGPKRIMAVGFGVGEVLRHGIDQGHDVTIAELHAAVPRLFRQFNPDHRQYLENPRAHIHLEDGRNFLLRTRETFDLIFVDVSPPLYASGMVNLYTQDFARLVRSRLAPGGLFVLWFPLVCFEQEFWMILRNFAETFPSIAMMSLPRNSNAVLMGSTAGPHAFDMEQAAFEEHLRRVPGAPPTIGGALWRSMFRPEEALRRRALSAPLLTDDRPYTEYPLQPFLRGETFHSDNGFLYRLRRIVPSSP